MSSVAAASDSPPTVTVSLAGTSLPKRLQDMLAPVLSARRKKAFLSACKTGGNFALVQSELQKLLRANPFARKQSNRDIHQVTHDRGACQKGRVKVLTVIYFLLLVATRHIGKN